MRDHAQYNWLVTMRNGGAVQRYHTSRMTATQDVAAHSWGVALVLLAIGQPLRVQLLMAALLHDMAEQVTGDIPAPAKWDSPALADALTAMERKFEDDTGLSDPLLALTAMERCLLRWADIYELTQWCMEQVYQGNRYAVVLLSNGVNATYRANEKLQAHVLEDELTAKAVGALTMTLYNEVQPHLGAA